MPTVDQIGLIVRLMAAVVWTPLLWRSLRGQTVGGTYLRRVLIAGSFTALLWATVIRGAAIVGLLATDGTTVVITAAIFMCFVAGVTLLTVDPVEPQ